MTSNLRIALLREGEPDLLPFVELKYDHEIMEAILGRRIPRAGYSSQEKRSQSATDDDTMRQYYRLLSEFHQKMGHDYIRGRLGLSLPLDDLNTTDTAELAAGNRTWRNESRGPISSWADFDRYPWPEFSDIDFRPLEYAAEAMAEGMKHTRVYHVAVWVRAALLRPLRSAGSGQGGDRPRRPTMGRRL